MESDPIAEYRAARRRAFTRIQEVRDRSDAWLEALDLNALTWSAIAHMEGLNVERQQAIDELQAAERRMIEALVVRIQGPRPLQDSA